MILSYFAVMTALGFAGFVLGRVFQYQGVMVIGAVLIVGAGALVTTDGLQYKSGVEVTNKTANTTVKAFKYQTAPQPTNLPVGAVLMLLGGALTLRGLDSI